MPGSLFAKFRPVSQGGERSDRVSILLPFLIISAGLGVVAFCNASGNNLEINGSTNIFGSGATRTGNYPAP